MKIHLWAFGSPSDPWVAEGEKMYIKRIERYMPFEYKNIQPSKSKQVTQVLTAEAKWMQQQVDKNPSRIILLDEHAPQFTSIQFAKKLDQWRQGTHKKLIFLIGSSYGFDESIAQAADEKMSLSSMTLPHQLCRLLFLEQIYRACTILRGESYHHE